MPITAEQYAKRHLTLNASEMPAVLGVDPYKNALDVYWDKLEPKPWEEPSVAADLGNRLEHAVIAWVAEQLEVGYETNVPALHPDGVFAATLDAEVLGRREAIEVKTTGLVGRDKQHEWGTEGTDEVPERVLIQTHAQMLCADLDVVHVGALIGGRGFALFHVQRNQDLIDVMVERGLSFWRNHVEKRVPPEDLLPSPETLKRLPRSEGKRVSLPIEVADAYFAAKDAYKAAKDQYDAAKSGVLVHMGDAEIAETPYGLITYKETVSKRFDTKAFKKARPQDYDAFLTESRSRSLREKKA